MIKKHTISHLIIFLKISDEALNESLHPPNLVILLLQSNFLSKYENKKTLNFSFIAFNSEIKVVSVFYHRFFSAKLNL